MVRLEQFLREYSPDILAVLAAIVVFVPLIVAFGLFKILVFIVIIAGMLLFVVAGFYLVSYIGEKIKDW